MSDIGRRDNAESVTEDDGNEINTQLLELQDSFVHALTVSGTLGKLRAQLRAIALGLIRGDGDLQTSAVGDVVAVPQMPLESRIAVLLIQDFLGANKLDQTAGVFEAEGSPLLAGDDARAAVSEKFYGMSGKGSMLERLVSRALNSEELSPGPSSQGGDSPRSTDVAAKEEPEVAPEPAAEVSPDVAKALANYEDSLAYSDAVGELAEDLYDEIEFL